MLPDEPRPPADPTPRPTGGSGLHRCYRHPEQETGIGCGRCGRPICPLCMVSASVGFHCPECVSGGHREVRRATTRFGGQLTADGALVTKVLVGLNLAVFVLAAYVLKPWLANDLSLFSVGPQITGFPSGVAAGPDQWYRLLTATFLHTAPWHIATNMVVLWVMGPPLEMALGRLRYLGLYLVSGLAGSAFAFLVAGGFMNSLGASGAVYGLFGATAVMYRRTRTPLAPVIALLVFNLIVTFSVHSIDWRAHIGGLVAGTLTAIGLMYAPRERRTAVQGLTVAVMAGVVLLLVLIGTARYGG
ncbi:rhomboid family intramembrane serine protease [Kitasatospora sp. NPDC088351]|uniref:rhomboid family intramembrane serine protease n=1 Tax=unclassified Kitasatospora TaxID=2633591 RepID=UPI00342B61C9